MAASPKTVCVPCRRVYKGEGRRHATTTSTRPVAYFPKKWMGNGAGIHDAPQVCPECGADDLLVVPWTWRPPRRRDDRAWKRIAAGDLLTEHDPKTRLAPFRNPNWKPGQGHPVSAAPYWRRRSTGSKR